MKSKIPIKEDNPNGLHRRFVIRKIVRWQSDGFLSHKPITKSVDQDAEYFVMRLDTGGSDIEHIKACRIGIHAYADAIQHHLPDLSKDLKERYQLL